MRTVALVVACCLLASCARYDVRTLRDLATTKADMRQGTAVYVSRACPSDSTEEAAALLGLVASFAADFAIGYISKSLDEAKKGLDGQFMAVGVPDEVLDLSKPWCLVVVSGIFGTNSSAVKGGPSFMTASLLNKLGLVDIPSFYLEAKLEPDGNALVVKPFFLNYAASSARNPGSGKKNVTAVIGMFDTVPAKPKDVDTADSLAVFRHQFGRLEIGKSYDETLLKGTAASQPKPASAPSRKVNIVALVTESEEPGLALQALTATFESKKGDLQKLIEDALKRALGSN